MTLKYPSFTLLASIDDEVQVLILHTPSKSKTPSGFNSKFAQQAPTPPNSIDSTHINSQSDYQLSPVSKPKSAIPTIETPINDNVSIAKHIIPIGFKDKYEYAVDMTYSPKDSTPSQTHVADICNKWDEMMNEFKK